MIFYHMKSILKDPARETMEKHFSLVFYEKIPKNKKLSFLVTKSGQIWIWQYFIVGQSSNCVSLHFSIIFGQIFFLGQKSWF